MLDGFVVSQCELYISLASFPKDGKLGANTRWHLIGMRLCVLTVMVLVIPRGIGVGSGSLSFGVST
jgi:hypothetical protein